MPEEPDEPTLEPPMIDDGAALWRLAADTGELVVNSPYAYLLWCRLFAATSVVARAGARAAGFVTGYLRPDAPETLMVWHVAVGSDHRRQGLAGRMLDHLADRLAPGGVRFLETTITPGNGPSQRLFGAFAERREAAVDEVELFAADHFPAGEGHEPEVRYRIGPFGSGARGR